jgi:site-specific recombinase XerD
MSEVNKVPSYLKQKDIANVIAEADKLPTRDRAAIHLLYSSGIRSSELCTLKIRNVNLSEQTAFVTGNNPRSVLFTKACAILLTKLIEDSLPGQEYVFVNQGNPISPKWLYDLTTKFGKKIKLKISLHPRVFRHTFACILISKGIDLASVAHLLGHSNLSTTRNYVRVAGGLKE